MSTDDDVAKRFSNRVGPYMRGRPGYPENAIDLLQQRGYLGTGVEVADLGAGTGILTAQTMDRGSTVWAIEPNDAMRSVAEAQLGNRGLFHSVAGRADDTSLPDDSVDSVICGQSFHWFDTEAARDEIRRILRDPKRVAVIWMLRSETTPFMAEFEALVKRHATDYEDVVGRIEESRKDMDTLFGGRDGDAYTHQRVNHFQKLDFPNLEALVSSYSYMPEPGSDAHAEAMKELRELWQEHEEGGTVRVEYDTHLVWGVLD